MSVNCQVCKSGTEYGTEYGTELGESERVVERYIPWDRRSEGLVWEIVPRFLALNLWFKRTNVVAKFFVSVPNRKFPLVAVLFPLDDLLSFSYEKYLPLSFRYNKFTGKFPLQQIFSVCGRVQRYMEYTLCNHDMELRYATTICSKYCSCFSVGGKLLHFW